MHDRDEPSEATLWTALSARPLTYLTSPWPFSALGHLLGTVVLGLALLCALIVSMPFVPLWAPVVGAIERRRLDALGIPNPGSGHLPASNGSWLTTRLAEPATWREVGVVFVNTAMALFALIFLSAQMGLLVLLTSPAISALTGTEGTTVSVGVPLRLPTTAAWMIAFVPVVVAVFAYANGLLAASHSAVLLRLLRPSSDDIARALEVEIATLTQSRQRIIAAEDSQRRRIERDLHDGAQQELVALAIRLGSVSFEIDALTARGADTAAAQEALRGARSQMTRALDSLRDTVRGIRPHTLTQSGLVAACQELAQRLPITMTVDAPDRLHWPEAIETTCYFVVSEVLNNAVKHSEATAIHLRIRENHLAGPAAEIQIRDNGRGGAAPEEGTGLLGLAERAKAFRGVLAVLSPPGRGTTVSMTLPLSGDPSLAASNQGVLR